MLASRNGHVNTVETLLMHGVDVTIKSRTGKYTALSAESQYKKAQCELATLTIAQYADVHKIDTLKQAIAYAIEAE